MKISTPKHFSDLVRETRIARNLSQLELAGMLGTTKQWVSRLESGANSPILDTVLRLCLILAIDLDATAIKNPKLLTPTKNKPINRPLGRRPFRKPK